MKYVLSPSALTRTALAISPLAELLGTLMVAERRSGVFAHPRAGSAERATLHAFTQWRDGDPIRAGFANLVAHTTWLPDFVGLAPPATGDIGLEEELAQIVAWDPGRTRATLHESADHAWTMQDRSWFDSDDLPAAIAEHLHTAWTLLVAPTWQSRRQVLRREIAFRSGMVAAHGWAGAVDGMGRQVTWEEPGVLVPSRRTDRTVTVDSYLRFIPVTHTDGIWLCDGPDGVALVYGARGTRADPGNETVGALARLLGGGRSALLLALDVPATPTQLHLDLDLALGTVGGHLRVLAEAGLVEKARVERAVYYRRSALGEDLVAHTVGGPA